MGYILDPEMRKKHREEMRELSRFSCIFISWIIILLGIASDGTVGNIGILLFLCFVLSFLTMYWVAPGVRGLLDRRKWKRFNQRQAETRKAIGRLQVFITDYTRSYELDTGDYYHDPTAFERRLMEDSINGLLTHPEFLRLLKQWQKATRKQSS